MLSKKMEKAFNEQFNAEYFSSYLYLSMAAYFESINLGGFAHWMQMQAKEEHEHAMKFFAHINERRGRVLLTAIEAPKTEWKSPLDVMEEVFKHEQKVTSLIHKLVGLANSENDYASQGFLQWFVKEQVEEEATADGIVQMLKMIKDGSHAIIMLDRELARRQ